MTVMNSSMRMMLNALQMGQILDSHYKINYPALGMSENDGGNDSGPKMVTSMLKVWVVDKIQACENDYFDEFLMSQSNENTLLTDSASSSIIVECFDLSFFPLPPSSSSLAHLPPSVRLFTSIPFTRFKAPRVASFSSVSVIANNAMYL